jgi:hypothetical protein
MSELWLPQTTPPQINEEAKILISSQLLEAGVIHTGQLAIEQLQNREQNFGIYLDELGMDLNQASSEGYWPERVLKIGAGLAWLAYRQTGYFQSIDDRLEEAQGLALLDGIPEAYISSLACDQSLSSLMSLAVEDPDFKRPNRFEYQQILDVGAGCVRYYFESTLRAA